MKPSEFAESGIAWWNGLSESKRRYWMDLAGNTGIVRDAYAAFLLREGKAEERVHRR